MLGKLRIKSDIKALPVPLAWLQPHKKTGQNWLLGNDDYCYLVASESTASADVMLHGQFIEQLVINLDCAINILNSF